MLEQCASNIDIQRPLLDIQCDNNSSNCILLQCYDSHGLQQESIQPEKNTFRQSRVMSSILPVRLVIQCKDG